MDELAMATVIPIGWVVVPSLIPSFAAAMGVNLQKLSMNDEERRPEHLQRIPYLQPYWLLGTAVIVLDGVGDFIFVGMAPQSLLAPLGGLGLGWNIILAPIFHTDEKVTPCILGATAVIYAGTIVAVLNAASDNLQYDLAAIVRLIEAPGFAVYMGIFALVVVVLVLDGGRRGYELVHYCGIAGAFGGLTLLFAKSSSEILQHAVLSGNFADWTSGPLPYLFLLGMVACVALQLHHLNKGLARFEALLVVPVYQTLWTVFAISGGLIFFQEYRVMTRRGCLLYIVGNCISLVGVTILVIQRKKQSSEADAPLQGNRLGLLDRRGGGGRLGPGRARRGSVG